MSRRSKKKPEELPPEPELAPAPPEEPPAPEPEPAQPVQKDEELPPPPSDIAEEAKGFPPLSPRKVGPFKALKRTAVILRKDVTTIAKHGLISSIILLIFLTLIFYIASYGMFMMVTTSFEEGGEGEDGGPEFGNDGSLIADAGTDRTVTAGTLVTLSSAASVHRADIAYAEWRIENNDDSMQAREVALYGEQGDYRFNQVGSYTVGLVLVDSDWNMDETNVSVTVTPSTSDTTIPTPGVTTTPDGPVTFGTPVTFDGTGSTDDVGVVNWTWTFRDVVPRTAYGPSVTYNFMSTGDINAVLFVRDASGNAARLDGSIQVMSATSDYQRPNAEMAELPGTVYIGDEVNLDASMSSDDGPIESYTWYIKLNNTMFSRSGSQASFTATGFGMYEITLIVRDQGGNAGTRETGVLSISAGMEQPSQVRWGSTPFEQDVPLNVLTFAYGAALLASVIYIGGLFSKGFAHEIQKGTAKTLFFAPVSVTNLVFAKVLYPITLGPLFILPLVMISLSPLEQEPSEILIVGLVAYLLSVLLMVSAAYGSCMIYAATKKLTIKPTALARAFMYLSLFATLTVFQGLAFVFDQWMETDLWNTYGDLGSSIAMFSPFHQGGLLLSNMLMDASQTPDWIVFVIPLALIVGGVTLSRRLYPDLFSRE